jgi:DNA-binding XRE family transcriptional regulator
MSTVRLRTNILRNGNCKPVYLMEGEITVQCPRCLDIETLAIEEGRVIAVGHWRLFNGNIFHHNCEKPARMINMSGRKILVQPSENFDINLLFKKSGKTVKELAVHIGVSRITVKRWMSGKSRPNTRSEEKIARFFQDKAEVQ